jgi:RNA polymerase sigma factor (sigma-70 family)
VPGRSNAGRESGREPGQGPGGADDRRLTAALAGAQADAVGDLFEAYGERLYDYAHSLLADPAAAAGAVHDAFVTAAGQAGRCQDPARLRSWLYAFTRLHALARSPRPAARPRPSAEEAADPELLALVHDACAELGTTEREVLDLSLRHGLVPGEVGAVLGLSSRQVSSRLARAREHLEGAAAALVLARTRRAHCPDLSAMVDSWTGPLTPMLRRRLAGHIGGCEVCAEGRRRQVAAERLLEMLPAAFPPLSLRGKILDTCGNPEREPARTLIMERTGALDRSGFPTRKGAARTGGRPGRTDRAHRTAGVNGAGATGENRTGGGSRTGGRRARRSAPRRPATVAAVAAVAAIVLAATVVVVVLSGRTGGGPFGTAQAAPRPGASEPIIFEVDPDTEGAPVTGTGTGPDAEPTLPGDPRDGDPTGGPADGSADESDEPGSASGPSPRPSATGTPRRAAAPAPTALRDRPAPTRRPTAARPTATRPTATRPTASRTRTPSPTAPRFSVACPGAIGDDGATRITLSARGSAISWRATTTGELSVRPSRGTLRAGAGAAIWVTVDDPGTAGSGTVNFSSAGGDPRCAISWQGQEPPIAEPPTDPPAPASTTSSGTPSAGSATDHRTS